MAEAGPRQKRASAAARRFTARESKWRISSLPPRKGPPGALGDANLRDGEGVAAGRGRGVARRRTASQPAPRGTPCQLASLQACSILAAASCNFSDCVFLIWKQIWPETDGPTGPARTAGQTSRRAASVLIKKSPRWGRGRKKLRLDQKFVIGSKRKQSFFKKSINGCRRSTPYRRLYGEFAITVKKGEGLFFHLALPLRARCAAPPPRRYGRGQCVFYVMDIER